MSRRPALIEVWREVCDHHQQPRFNIIYAIAFSWDKAVYGVLRKGKAGIAAVSQNADVLGTFWLVSH